MRSLRIWTATFFAAQLTLGCSPKHTETDHDVPWPEMASFHKVMAEVYHPYKDSAELRTLKEHAEDLALEADHWAASPIPASLDNDEMKPRLQKLKSEARSLADEIKAGATDEKIGHDLTVLHESFHGIMEATQADKDHDH